MAKKKSATPNVHLAVVIDESGSMGGRQAAVVEGVNQFAAELAKVDGDPTFVTVRSFDTSPGRSKIRTWRDNVPLDKFEGVRPHEYQPRGGTPLNDAIADTITLLEGREKGTDRTLMVIVTDGFENASEMKTEVLREVVSEKEKQGWEFIYLGANVDSFAESRSSGMANAAVKDWSGSQASNSNAFATSGKLAGTLRRAGGQALYASAKTAVASTTAENDTELQAQYLAIDEAVEKATEKVGA